MRDQSETRKHHVGVSVPEKSSMHGFGFTRDAKHVGVKIALRVAVLLIPALHVMAHKEAWGDAWAGPQWGGGAIALV